jgi:hypothetical protein
MSATGRGRMVVRYSPRNRSVPSVSSFRGSAGVPGSVGGWDTSMYLSGDSLSQYSETLDNEIVIIFWHWKKGGFEVEQPLNSLQVSSIHKVGTEFKRINDQTGFSHVMKVFDSSAGHVFFVGSEFESLFKDALIELRKKLKLTWYILGNNTLNGEIQEFFSRAARFWNWFWKMTSSKWTDYNPYFVLPPVYYRRPVNGFGTRGIDAPRTKYYVLPIYRQHAWLKSPTELFRCRDRRRWRLIYKDLDLKKNPRVLLYRYRVRLSGPRSYGIYVVQNNPLYDGSSSATKYKPPARDNVSAVMRGRAAFRGLEDEREDVDKWLTKGFKDISRKNTTRKMLTVLPQISSGRENRGMEVLYAFCHGVGLGAVHEDFDDVIFLT